MKRIVGLVVLLAASSVARAAEQFDLVCTGQVRLSAIEPWVQDRNHYRIDLANSRWCQGKCTIAEPLVAATATTLTLKHHEPAFARDSRTDFTIDRKTGALSQLEVGQVNIERRGTCEPAPYSGMPGDGPAKF